MQHWVISLGLLATFFCFSLADSDWMQEDSDKWGDDYPMCNGKEQSPIDLNSMDIWTPEMQEQNFKFTCENDNKTGDVLFTNTGYLANASFTFDSQSEAARVTVTEKGKPKEYYLRYMLYHWPSEHWILGRKSKVEKQFLYRSNDGGNVMVSFLYDVCDEKSSEQDQGYLIKSIINTGDTFKTKLKTENVQPTASTCDYYKYSGSFTTPPCTEDVTWLVWGELTCISQEEFDMYSIMDKNKKRISNNARSLQDLNNRDVVFLACGDEDED